MAITTPRPALRTGLSSRPMSVQFAACVAAACVWRGIPYAASTGGSGRFRHPRRHRPGPTPRVELRAGRPPEPEWASSSAGIPKLPRSEDCLSVNVIAPRSDVPPADGR